MQRSFYIIVFLLLGCVLTTSVALRSTDEPIPEGESGPKADSLAKVILKAVNDSAWQATRYVEWTFPGDHRFLWDKERHFVRVKWGDYRVLFNTKTQQGLGYRDKVQPITDASVRKRVVENAIKMFNNDSFWLCAPNKLFDHGTERKIVETDESEQPALLVTYHKGGSTPGDSYLWLIDENGRPEACKMWVSVFSNGGVKFTWEDWATTAMDAKIARLHIGPSDTIKLQNIRTYQYISGKDPFEAFYPSDDD